MHNGPRPCAGDRDSPRQLATRIPGSPAARRHGRFFSTSSRTFSGLVTARRSGDSSDLLEELHAHHHLSPRRHRGRGTSSSPWLGLTAPGLGPHRRRRAPVRLRRDRHPGLATAPAGATATGRTTATSRRPSRRPIAKDAKERLDKKPGGPVAGASVPVYVHVMAAANGDGDVTDAQIAQQIAVLNTTFAGQEGAQQHGLHLHPRRRRPLLQQQLAPGQAEHEVPRADPAGRRQRAQHVARRLQVPRHRDLPVGLQPQRLGRRHPGPLRLAAGRRHRQLQPRRDRDPRGGPLVRALPHLPGRLHRHERRGRRHPGPGGSDERLPRGRRHLPAPRHGPDPQLHGLQLRLLLHPVHRGPDHPHAADVLGLPGRLEPVQH